MSFETISIAVITMQVVAELARQLTAEFGKGWSEQQLRHSLRLAETFPDEQILSAVRRELSRSHLKTLIYIDEAMAPKRREAALFRHCEAAQPRRQSRRQWIATPPAGSR